MAGYVDLAASAATSISTPQTENAGTVFNFSSPGSTGDWYGTSNTGTADATATTAKDSPGAQLNNSSGAAISNTTLYIVAAIAAVGIIGAIIAFRR